MAGGFIGHGLGATPNAMANLDVITKKYGSSPKSYLVVPIVGAFLIDLARCTYRYGLYEYFWKLKFYIRHYKKQVGSPNSQLALFV